MLARSGPTVAARFTSVTTAPLAPSKNAAPAVAGLGLVPGSTRVVVAHTKSVKFIGVFVTPP